MSTQSKQEDKKVSKGVYLLGDLSNYPGEGWKYVNLGIVQDAFNNTASAMGLNGNHRIRKSVESYEVNNSSRHTKFSLEEDISYKDLKRLVDSVAKEVGVPLTVINEDLLDSERMNYFSSPDFLNAVTEQKKNVYASELKL